jgi:hypothetical protein
MKRIGLSIVVLTLCLGFNNVSQAQGVWTPLSNPNPAGGCGTMLLLTDGTVIVCAGTATIGESAVWTKLTPDAEGNYVNGTWTKIAPMATARYSFPSNVLPSGKVFVMGGEYSSAGAFTNLGEIYDPVSNTWSAVGKFPQSDFGDDPTIVLPNGKVLCGYIGDGVPTGGPLDGLTYLYDPATNQFTQTGTKLLQDQSDEETWGLLPDGSVLSYNIFASPAAGAGSAQRYIPSTGKWVATGPVPVPLSNLINDGDVGGLGAELGPMLLLPDGRMFLIGANNNTVLYTPSTDSWAQGPSLPTDYGCDDAPAAMLPNGKVIFLADNSLPIDFTPPTHAFLFDPVANSITNITPSGTLGSIMANQIAQQFCMLMLPNGHMLLSTQNSTVWDFAPTGSPSAAWAPTITKIANVSGNNYTLTGTQLTGISEGTSFGDDVENSTNYPIVRLKSGSGAVTYARTTNWTPGVATGSLQTSVNFAVPASLGIGTYSVSVIANGIASASQSVFIGGIPSNVVASYSSGTLSITGASATDNNPHNLTVTEAAGKITIQGANGTRINNQATYSVAVSGNWNLSVNFAGGDDSIAFIGVNQLPNANIQLGAGNDKAAFTLCTIGTLTINGGTGTNTFLESSSKFTKLNESNFTK